MKTSDGDAWTGDKNERKNGMGRKKLIRKKGKLKNDI